jgi:hypothetical protein
MLSSHVIPKKLIIYSTPRAGSTLLGSLLNSHPELQYKGEILVKSQWSRFPWRFLRRFAIKRISTWLQFISRGVPGIYACTLMQHQAMFDRCTLERLTHSGWKIVTLKRSDLIAQVLSMEIAWKFRRWHRYHGQDEIELKLFDIPKQYFIERLGFWHNIRLATEEVIKGINHHPLVYEDDLLSPELWQKTAEGVFNYLGIHEVPVSTNLVKFTNTPYHHFIRNYEELVESGRYYLRSQETPEVYSESRK